MASSPLSILRQAPWTPGLKDAGAVLWAWWDALQDLTGPPLIGADLEAECRRFEARRSVERIPRPVTDSLYRLIEAQRIPADPAVRQLRCVLAYPESRFRTAAELYAYVRDVAGGQAQLLGRLAGVKGAWQQPLLAHFGVACFLTVRLIGLPREAERGGGFLPEDTLEHAGIRPGDLVRHRDSEALKRILWRQVVAAKDALAQAMPLLREVERPLARKLRLVWLECAEWQATVERRRYRLWHRPLRLSPAQRFQIRWRAYLSRSVTLRTR